jgi:hypothetical protein
MVQGEAGRTGNFREFHVLKRWEEMEAGTFDQLKLGEPGCSEEP